MPRNRTVLVLPAIVASLAFACGGEPQVDEDSSPQSVEEGAKSNAAKDRYRTSKFERDEGRPGMGKHKRHDDDDDDDDDNNDKDGGNHPDSGAIDAGPAADGAACVPTTCADAGANCGTISDGCGAMLDCGACTAPDTCGGGGSANVCGQAPCTPTTCQAQGWNCGAVSDGCGGTLNCGSCPSQESCGGSGSPNVCGGLACIPPASPAGSGKHNAGAACLSCHVSGGPASQFPWTIAGTLYDTASGGTAVAGATIELIDANNQVVNIVTSTNGNFYTTTPVAFPVKARASSCPSDVEMVSPASMGNCNSCHGSGMRVHLP